MFRPLEENQFQVFKKIANFTQLPHYRNPIGRWVLDMEWQQVWRKTFVSYCVKGPPSPKRPCAPRLLFYEFCVTQNCFWAGFLSKSVSSGAILSKIVHKHAGIYSSIIRLLFPRIILWLSRPNVFFFRSYFVQYVSCQMIPQSQLKILHGYAEGKYCQYSSQRSLCYKAKKQIFYESLVVMSFKFLIVFDAGPWQVSLIRLIWFYSRDHVNRAARECVINEWFCRTVFFFFRCIYRRTIKLK